MVAAASIGFIGAGRVATALAMALVVRGYSVRAVHSRTRHSAERLAAMLAEVQPEPAVVASSAQGVANRCGLVFITTPDDAIAAVASGVRWRGGQGVVHCSGALSIDVLAPVVEAGGEAAGFHPLQTFARPGTSLQGVTIALEGAGPLIERLKAMAADLGGRWVLVPSDMKALYHIAGVLASNYVVALAGAATDILARLGIPEDEGRQAVVPLLAATVGNIEALGIPASLTGPIARGDLGTARRHLEALDWGAPELAEVYRALGKLAIPIARNKGTISAGTAERLRELLNHGHRDPDSIGARIPEQVEEVTR